MVVLDLFSGIGGFSLGLERAGMRTAAFCEIDPKARLVLQKHWPNVPIFKDVATLTAADMPEKIDVICGGFPCQDISLAGKGAGLAGERSGLWFQFRRLVEEIRPSWVIIENVSALRSRGLDTVLGGLAALGYDAEWHCIPASAVGAPHQRDRVWIVAYTMCAGLEGHWAERQLGETGEKRQIGGGCDVADASSAGLPGREWVRNYLAETQGRGQAAFGSASKRGPVSGRESHSWFAEPDVGRVADGVPKRVDRLKQLGNAVVPQIPEMIGRAILSCN